MKDSKRIYVFFILITVAVGSLGGLLSLAGIREYSEFAVKPPLTPPGILFPLVWTGLYILMGISAARIYLRREGRCRSTGLNLYTVQLLMNVLWSLIFFNARAYGLALAWLLLLWLVVFGMILCFRRTDRTAAALQVPYLLWITFVAYLNEGVWLLNR